MKRPVFSLVLLEESGGYLLQSRRSDGRVVEVEVNDLVSGMLTMAEVCRTAAREHIVFLLKKRPDLLPAECRAAIEKEFPGIQLGPS